MKMTMGLRETSMEIEKARLEQMRRSKLSEEDLNNLQWAKDFLNNYEKKHR